jgi:hypothetical protein
MMIRIYSYKPEGADSTSKAISFGVLGGAAILILLSEILAEYKPILMTAGFVLALFGVLFCSRFMLAGYTYIIESAADGSSPDLVITEQKGKVTTNGRELTYLRVRNILTLYGTKHLVPADVGKIDRCIDVECLSQFAGNDAHLGQYLTASVLHAKACTVDVVLAFAENKCAKGNAQAGKDVHDVSLELCKRTVFVGVSPTASDTFTRKPESEMIVFAVCIEYVFDDFRVAAAAYTLHDVGATAFLLEAIAIAKLEETKVGIAVADVACNAFQTAEKQCLAQHVKVLAKGIDEANQFFALVGL